MDCWQIYFSLISVLWLIFAPVSATSGHFKLAEAANDIEHAKKRELAAENSGLISIDCGTDKDYLDERTGIFFKSDADFVSTGEIHNVSPEYNTDDARVGRSINSLRSFPQGRKNCYTLKRDQPEHHYYHIRAYFRYGNYDGNKSLPVFNLYVGANYWGRINTTDSIASFHYIITDTIDVCLVNTGTGTPYISALQLRPLLNSSIYKIESLSLTGELMLDLGNSNYGVNGRFRPKDDAYDRFWTSYMESGWVSINISDVNFPCLNASIYKEVPVEVLRTAVQPAESGLNSLSYTYTNPYVSPYDFYFYFYFAELTKFEQAGKRRQVIVSLKNVNYGPITLDYLKPQILRSNNVSIQSNESVTFTIYSTVPDLAPILNAFELQVVFPWFTYSPTEAANVDAILDIKRIYKINREDWQGDPCIPIDFSWNGLRCSDGNFNDPPLIISLNLSSSNLDGEIVSSFSKLRAIQFLDLSYNKLTGAVPEFLGQLPNLTMLNLTGNNFAGPIPRSLIEKSKNGILQLSLDGNPNECHGESCEKKKRGFVVPIAASVLALLLILSTIAIVWRLKRPRTGNNFSFKSKNQRFTYSEIVSVTDNFRNIIGEGGFGKVYLGNLKDGTQVAVKLLSQSSTQGYKEFESEVQLLMVIHHRNLVSLIGYCDEPKNMALVYEYMQNGNLRQHLSYPSSANVLSWIQRLQIAVDAAQGLEYLHNGCRPPIIHRDLKTSNILLDQNLQAKISDFGLSRAFATDKDSHVKTRPAGTFGYVDPEFVTSGNLNKSSDVYSFGVILFEIITGQPVLMRGYERRTHILQWVGPEIESGDIAGIIDPRLQGEFNTSSAWKAVEIAMSCVPPTAIQRPGITHVLAELKECLAIEMESERPERMQKSITSINFMSNSLEMSLPSAR